MNSRELLIAQRKARLIKRRERLDSHVKTTLEAMGINDSKIDYQATKRTVKTNHDKTAIIGWRWTVTLKTGEVLMWWMTNADEAKIEEVKR